MKSEEEKAKLLLFTDIVIVNAENLIGRWHQESNIRSSPTSVPLTRPTSNYPQARHHWKEIPRTQGWAKKAPSRTRDREARRVATFWPHWAPPRLAHHTHRALKLVFPAENESREVDSTSPVWQDASREKSVDLSCPSLARCFLEAHSGLASPWCCGNH